MRSKPLSTSSFVTASDVRPLMRAAYRSATMSSQPVRRGRPVVVPNSPPRSRISRPISSSSSVGNGPAPTRVGAGPFPTELDDQTGLEIRERGGEFGTTTGRPRRVGWLDLVALRYAARINSLTALVVTKLDVLTGLETIKVCTRYRGEDGAEFDHFPYHQSVLHHTVGEYVELPGWSEDIGEARSEDELPDNARRYL